MQDRELFGQFGKADKLTLNWGNFWKIVLAMIVSCLVLGTAMVLIRILDKPKFDPVAQEKVLHERTVQSLLDLEAGLYNDWNQSIRSLDQAVSSRPEIEENVLMNWIENQPVYFSVTVLVNSQPFPIQYVPARFWESDLNRNASEEEKQQLLQFLFTGKQDSSWQPVSLLHVSSNSLPLVRFQIESSLPGRSYILVRTLNSIESLMSNILHDTSPYRLTDDRGVLLADHTTSDMEDETDVVTSSSRSERLNWILTLYEPVRMSSTPALLSNPFLYYGLGVLILISILIISLLITRWIDKPMAPLYETALRISRGNFSLRLPGSKSKTSNRLARLINYMVEEMDHLQKINVSKILIEKRKMETILKNIADAVIVSDNSDRILVLNAVAEKWFDCLDSVAVQQDVSHVLKEHALIQMIQRVRQKGQPDSAEFQMRVFGDIQPKTLHAHGAAVKSQDERQIGVVTVIRDVSEEREVERLKTELVSMVAHELKSPLTSIYGFSEMLLKSELKNERSKEYARVILNESSRLTDLVNKFLDLSKLESGTTEPRLRSFDIQESIQRMLDAHSQLATRKKIRVIFNATHTIPHALGDPDLVDQVLLNLFSNAVKYSASGAKVGIEVKTEGRYITVQVIDNGQGIQKKDMNRIFDKFFRADSSSDNEQNGSGLGLSLVKEIVNKLGGKVHVKSQPGVGSIFSFSLPQAVS